MTLIDIQYFIYISPINTHDITRLSFYILPLWGILQVVKQVAVT